MAFKFFFSLLLHALKLNSFRVYPLQKFSFKSLELGVLGRYLALDPLEVSLCGGGVRGDLVTMFVNHHIAEKTVFFDELSFCLSLWLLQIKIVLVTVFELGNLLGAARLAHHRLHVVIFVKLELRVGDFIFVTGLLPFKLLFIKHSYNSNIIFTILIHDANK